MRKWLICMVAALLMLNSTALAETYEGTTAAASTTAVEAESGGILQSMNVLPGSVVESGDILCEVSTTKVFATEDGVVGSISASEGDTISGSVLEVNPTQKYRIYCTIDSAYESPETMLVHSGEEIFIKCTKDGTHRATGIITELDGSEYQVIATGGELYIGETVYLYRDEDFSTEQRIGIGTVVESDAQSYFAEGVLTSLHVQEGEYVERGELLYEYADAAETATTSDVDGIVTSVNAEQGDRIQKGTVIMTIAPLDQICVEVSVDEEYAATLSIGDSAELVYAADDTETHVSGTIVQISNIGDDGTYVVRVKPDSVFDNRIGLTVTVRF